ncbi:stage II sporulation protein D [Sporosarcina sp. P26b]|uniref:stage II sporulation protein D n=1 Tax=Sporosarcina TaxID=1569 RepID=UPI000A17DF55|nr:MULTISPECIES: stage II sporulation protein D [Sporosarcina]ARK22223.1 stage II sporulation protein D [Sporosarcina ureae]PIC74173.1 stage II sporulation protein D [Sporosarcina sp. P17b]PIC95734.1 stage II sporulation protein D [Sporosarcina sp. P26b]
MYKKLLVLFIIFTLFIIPILVRQAPELKLVEQREEKYCDVLITVIGVDEPIPLEEYVVGVVAGEMPADFHPEALKAQVIAARTYAARNTDKGVKPIAKDVSAQVYRTEAERKERWGKSFKDNEKKVRQAAEATEGKIIVYGEEIISAMFFSTSNGKTEAAQNFSGNPVEYLQSVDSPGEEDVAPTVERKQELTLTEWNRKLGFNWNANQFRELQLVRNQTGRVQKIIAGPYETSGRQIREKLHLASTDFNIAYDVNNQIVLITTVGYGHGVGMSQYGAEAFAQKGWTADQILSHYYTGTKIQKINLPEDRCLKSP